MRRRTGDRLAALALAAAGALAAAVPSAARADEVRVELSADRTELAQDEVLLLTVTVTSDAAATLDLGERDLPFTVLSRTRSTDAASFAFGPRGGVRLRRKAVYTIALAPKRTGELAVGPIAAIVDGARHEAAPLRVTVRPAPAGARKAPPSRAAAPPRAEHRSGVWHGWERDLALEVQLDRREVFVGEQVTATVVLRSPVGVVAYERFQPPPYDGFWAEEVEVPRRLAFAVRSVAGVPTRVYTVRKLALFPTRAGRLELGPFEVDVAVRLGSDALFAAFDELRRARRASAPVAVVVKPLPPGAPQGFEAGNVGAWKLSAAASAGRVAAGEPVAIRVTAEGRGNVHALALPPLPAVAGARAFASTASETVTRSGGRLGGTRTVETVIVPEREGTLEVPPLAWPFFSPRTGAYEVARTPALRIEVTPGSAPPPAVAGPPLADALRPVRTDGALARPAPPPWERLPFRAALALPPLAFAALALADLARARARATAPARRARRAGPRARDALSAARRTLARGDARAALDAAAAALRGYAEDTLGRPASGPSREALAAALRGAGVSDAGVGALAEALEACDAARFGGAVPPEDALGLAERAVELLRSRRGAEAAP